MSKKRKAKKTKKIISNKKPANVHTDKEKEEKLLTKQKKSRILSWLKGYSWFLGLVIPLLIGIIGFIMPVISFKFNEIRQNNQIIQQISNSSSVYVDKALYVLDHVYNASYDSQQNLYYLSPTELFLDDNIDNYITNHDSFSNANIEYQNLFQKHKVWLTDLMKQTTLEIEDISNKSPHSDNDTIVMSPEDRKKLIYFLYAQVFRIDFNYSLEGDEFAPQDKIKLEHKINMTKVLPKIRTTILDIEKERKKGILEAYCEVCAENMSAEEFEHIKSLLPRDFKERYNIK